MKQIIAKVLALFMTVALFSTTALAFNDEIACNSINTGVSTASVKAAISLTVNGVTYSIPGGAASTVGYGYKNDSTYVYRCQLAINKLYFDHLDDTIQWTPCNCGNPDGIFGPKTHDGILGFQRTNNFLGFSSGWPELAEDGVCGDSTWKQLAFLSH